MNPLRLEQTPGSAATLKLTKLNTFLFATAVFIFVSLLLSVTLTACFMHPSVTALLHYCIAFPLLNELCKTHCFLVVVAKCYTNQTALPWRTKRVQNIADS